MPDLMSDGLPQSKLETIWPTELQKIFAVSESYKDLFVISRLMRIFCIYSSTQVHYRRRANLPQSTRGILYDRGLEVASTTPSGVLLTISRATQKNGSPSLELGNCSG